jgi:hypothetical protein
MIQIILSSFIDDMNKIVLGRTFIRDDLIHFPDDQGCFVACVINTKNETHISSLTVLGKQDK